MREASPPMESPGPLVVLALVRLAIVLTALALVIALGLPSERGALVAVLVGLALPWSAALLWVSLRAPAAALHPAVAAGDFLVLAVAEAAAPDVYAGARFVALVLISIHAQFQGGRAGLLIAGGGALALVVLATAGDSPLSGRLLALSESVFVLCALAVALVGGRLRAAESTGRLRARELSQRRFEAEYEVRRRVAESIHDGPVQELVGLEMVLSSAQTAMDRGDRERARRLLADARELVQRNIGALREEIIGLGPAAFAELRFAAAVERCVPMWERRYGIAVRFRADDVDLPSVLAGALFGIAQEAVVNAGRHAGGSAVEIKLTRTGDAVVLSVSDDGHGFGDVDPLGELQPGHIGLASMRERADLVGGALEIDTGPGGTTVTARAPLEDESAGEEGGAKEGLVPPPERS